MISKLNTNTVIFVNKIFFKDLPSNDFTISCDCDAAARQTIIPNVVLILSDITKNVIENPFCSTCKSKYSLLHTHLFEEQKKKDI